MGRGSACISTGSTTSASTRRRSTASKSTCCSRPRWQESPRPTATARGPGLTTARASQPLPVAHRRVRRPPARLAPPSPERAAAAAPGWPTVGVSESHFVLGCLPRFSKFLIKGRCLIGLPLHSALRSAVQRTLGARTKRRAGARGRARARGRGGCGLRRCADRWIMDDGLLAAAPVDGLEDCPLQFDVDWLWPGLGLCSLKEG